MKIKQKMLRFLSVFLVCIMTMNVPLSVLASSDSMFMDMAEEEQLLEVFSEQIMLPEEGTMEETMEEAIEENFEETENSVFRSSIEDGSDEMLFEDGNLELEENIEMVDGEVLTEELFSAGEYEAEKISDGTYQVTVKVAPKEADVTFYYDSSATIEMQENVQDEGIVDGYHQYTLIAKEGTYAYRATEGEQSLGGMEFKVPIADEYASDGTLMGKGQILTLRRMNFLTTSSYITKADDYTLHLIPQDLNEAISGTNYVNENGNVVCPIMINAAGNALTYNMVVDINGELGTNYAVTPVPHMTFGAGTSAGSNTFVVSAVTCYTITAPAEAKAQMFNQKNNYNVVEIPVSKTETLEDGTVKSYFATPGGQSITYRVSMKNKVTRAGFATTSNKDMVFEFKAYENPKSTVSSAKRIENSSMVNINSQNNLKMSVGETFRLRSFRAGWQIINTDTANIMIEPDFHYNIISGAEHITLNPVTDKTTGNAGSGMNANWVDITAVSAGTVVLEVSYDAIQIGGDTQYPGTFGAVDPARKSVVVINIGGNQENTLVVTPSVVTVAPNNGPVGTYDWEADFDTVYFIEDSANFNFTATMGGATPDKVELSTDLGNCWTEVNKHEGVYNAKGLVSGNNIFRVTKGGSVEYQVVRASRLNVTTVNMTRGGDTIIAGDEVRVLFSGIYTPIPKMSGIYNPGFNEVHRTVYTLPEGVAASSTSSQYGFAADNQYTITFSSAGTHILTDGYITGGVMGDPIGAHRFIADSGRGVNFNAGGYFFGRSILPELTFEVIGMPVVDVTLASRPEGAAFEITDESGTLLEANEDGIYVLEYGTYSYKATMEGYALKRGTFTVGGDDRLSGKKEVTIVLSAVGGDIWDGKLSTEPQKNEEGAYLIGTGAELAWFAENHGNANAILTSDIILGGSSVKISSYKGTFDGNGHYIYDFYSTESLFYKVGSGAIIKNLGVTGEIVSTDTKWAPGGIVMSTGDKVKFEVQNCVSRVDVKATVGSAGGIVGMADSVSSSECPHISNCYNTGRINASGYGYAGGIAGYRGTTPFMWIKNSYNIGTVNRYGISITGRGTNTNNYYLLGSASEISRAAGTSVQADTLKTYASILGEAYIDNPTSYNDGYPILTWEEPRALLVAMEEFAVELENYKDMEDYRKAQQKELKEIIEIGKEAIKETATLTDAQTVLAEAKAKMETVKTDAELSEETQNKQSAEIYLSISNDDYFYKGNNGEILALKEISVPYFDLALYGLQQYYFVSESYEKDDSYTGTGQPSSSLNAGNAEYAAGKVTMLHALIYATEIYYCGIEPDDAGKGYLKEANLIGTKVFSPEGSTGSMYIRHFWGMDENFNYYLNYKYPLASEGWGSTADQILLHDGDVVTLGHFTSWDFHLDSLSVFNFIKSGEDIIHTTVRQGKALEVSVVLAGAGGNYTTAHTPKADRGVYISKLDEITQRPTQWNQVGMTDENGKILIDTRDLESGEYIVATPGVYGNEYKNAICSTPGAILLTVKAGSAVTNFEGMVTFLLAPEELTIYDAEVVNAAREAYDALTAGQKTLVSKEVQVKLKEAEAKIAELKKAEEEAGVNKEAAGAVANAVSALPAVDKLTAADAETVKSARAVYEALTDAQKALISAETLKQLEAAEAKIAELTHVHLWDAGTVTKTATCKETGVKTYTCTGTVNGKVCGQTKTETVAKTSEHSYGEWGKVSAATVFKAEVQKHTCSVCKTSETKSVGKALKAVLELPGNLKGFQIQKGISKKFAVTMANGDKISSAVSSNSNCLKVQSVAKKDGLIKVKGLKAGTTKLKITLASGKTRTYTVKVVTGTVKTTGLSVTNVTDKKLTLEVKKSHTLQSERKPFTSTQKLTYKSSNKKIAKVSSSGKITAVAPGKATITVTSGSKNVKITITVPGIANVKSSVSVKKNKTLTLNPKTYGIRETVTYTSSNTKVATVTSKGKIKGIKKGTAKITIKAGNYKKTVTVNVK